MNKKCAFYIYYILGRYILLLLYTMRGGMLSQRNKFRSIGHIYIIVGIPIYRLPISAVCSSIIEIEKNCQRLSNMFDTRRKPSLSFT